MRVYLISVDDEFVRDAQVCTDNMADHASENWSDINGGIILGQYAAEHAEKALEEAAKEYGIPAENLYATRIHTGPFTSERKSTFQLNTTLDVWMPSFIKPDSEQARIIARDAFVDWLMDSDEFVFTITPKEEVGN